MILKKIIYLFLFAPLLVHAFEFPENDLEKVRRITAIEDFKKFPSDSLPENSYLRRAMLQIYFDSIVSDNPLKTVKKNFKAYYLELAEYAAKYSIGIKDTSVAGYLSSLGYEVRNKNYFLASMQKDPEKYTSLIMKNFISDNDLLSFVGENSSYIDDSVRVRYLMLHPYKKYVDSIAAIGRTPQACGFVRSVLESDTLMFKGYADNIDEWISYVKDREFMKLISALAQDSVKNDRLLYLKCRAYEEKGDLKRAFEL